MAVLNKEKHKMLMYELRVRYETLARYLEARELKSAHEGAGGRAKWRHPEAQCATLGDVSQIRLSIEDFKVILAELKRLK